MLCCACVDESPVGVSPIWPWRVCWNQLCRSSTSALKGVWDEEVSACTKDSVVVSLTLEHGWRLCVTGAEVFAVHFGASHIEIVCRELVHGDLCASCPRRVDYVSSGVGIIVLKECHVSRVWGTGNGDVRINNHEFGKESLACRRKVQRRIIGEMRTFDGEITNPENVRLCLAIEDKTRAIVNTSWASGLRKDIRGDEAPRA
mmetsp:Transcript_53367/g.115861  ORF Transcript_53367/g.115861 Transcript_53367/m.115861 type:complete len:202 (-) Transcript_53367:32-637(-)